MRKLNLRTKKAFFKSVKNISVLNVAFSKSVLVLIKNGCMSPTSVLVFVTDESAFHSLVRAGGVGVG